jgi:hypothetical protein
MLGFGASPAAALVPIPIGTPLGSATDLLTLSGTYSSLPDPAAQPFASADFTLSLIVPAQVSVSADGPVLSEFSVPVSGSYTDGGVTEHFSTPFALFGATNIGLPTFPDNFTLIIDNLLQPADSFIISFQADGPLFSPTIFTSGQPETIATGSFSVALASAAYDTGDPDFTGALTITPQSAVPEPSSWALALLGFAGLGAAARAGKRREALSR